MCAAVLENPFLFSLRRAPPTVIDHGAIEQHTSTLDHLAPLIGCVCFEVALVTRTLKVARVIGAACRPGVAVMHLGRGRYPWRCLGLAAHAQAEVTREDLFAQDLPNAAVAS